MRFAVTIAGSDPTGGAGLQADVQVFRAHGVHGGGVPTALTVQDGRKVHQVLPVFPSVVLAQIRGLGEALRPDAVKLGMLATDDVARAVALGLCGARGDGGARAAPRDRSGAGGERRHAAPRAPRLADALRARARRGPGDAEPATRPRPSPATTPRPAQARSAPRARSCGSTAPRRRCVKGGHREGAPDDLLAWREGGDVALRWLPGERIAGGGAHGTGCALSAAITARLARGEPLHAAVEGRARLRRRGAAARRGSRGGARFLVLP